MERRRIGKLEVSLVGLGCNNFGWRIDKNATAAVVHAALDAGINFLDTADMYGAGQSEEYLAGALGNRRDEIVLATKFGFSMGDGKSGASPVYIREAVEASLTRLKTDRIDLYQLHTPDRATPIADTLGALGDLVKQGKVLEIGCSNFSAEQLREAAAAVPEGSPGFASVQNEYSLLNRTAEAEVLPECKRQGIAFIPYFPLANGLLTGKYRKGQSSPENSRGKDGWGPSVFTDSNLDLVESLHSFASSHGHSLLELAISWLATQDCVPSVIAGAKTPQQAIANAAAANWKLSKEELAQIDEIVLQTA